MRNSIAQEVGEEMGLTQEQIKIVAEALQEDVLGVEHMADPDNLEVTSLPTPYWDKIREDFENGSGLLFVAFNKCEDRIRP